MAVIKTFILQLRLSFSLSLSALIIALTSLSSSSVETQSFQFNSNFAKNLQLEEEGIQILIENINEGFSGCEHVYIEQTTIDEPIENQSESNNNYSPGLKNSFRNFELEKLTKLSAGVHQLSLGFNLTFPRHRDIHRLAKLHCSLALLIINSKFTAEEETWLVETVLPRYGPVLRKDLDHFLFIFPNEQISDKILLSPQFGSKIKYKLGLIPQPDSNKVLCKTVDLYGNNGLSQLKVLTTFDPKSVSTSKGERDLIKTFDFFPDMTKNFNGKIFRFAIPKVAFRFEIETREDGRYHPKRGFYKWWLDEAMLKFNFTYDIFWASFGGGTGKRLKNGTWVGATGDIYYGKADCSFIVGEIYSRHKFLGWSSSISYEWVVFVTHMPRKSYSPKAIFWPFSPLMWGLFLVTLILVTFSLKGVAQAGLKIYAGSDKREDWGSVKIFEYLFSTLMEQDSRLPSLSSSSRVLCTFWLLFAIVTATAYRGKLVSLIAFPVDTWVPTTFEELANSHFKVALNVVGKAGAAYVLIASSTSPVFQTITARMELIPEAEVCLERAMSEDLGCIIWKGIADYAAVKNLTDKDGRVPLQESTQIALFIGDGLVYERRAIFGEHLDRTIQAVVQMGLTIKWFQLDQKFIMKERRTYERSRGISKPIYDYDDGGPKKLILSQFTGLFLLLLCGVIISGGQFVGEHFWHKRSTAKLNSEEGGHHNGNDDGRETTNSVFNDGSSSSSTAARKKELKQALFDNSEVEMMMMSSAINKSYWDYTTYI